MNHSDDLLEKRDIPTESGGVFQLGMSNEGGKPNLEIRFFKDPGKKEPNGVGSLTLSTRELSPVDLEGVMMIASDIARKARGVSSLLEDIRVQSEINHQLQGTSVCVVL